MNINKQILLSVSLVLASIGGISASPLTPDAALARVRNTKNANIRLKMAARQPRLAHTQMAGGAAALYVFNQSDSEGFMILPADDVAPELLAYSDCGTIETDNMPPAFVEWMTSIGEEISYVAAHHRNPRTSPNTTGGWADIEPLMTTHWGQGQPYNMYCPQSEGQTSVVGCAATAMAQVMNFYKWPQRAKGSKSYTTATLKLSVSVDFDDANVPDYDWNNMADWYDHDEVHEYGGKWYGHTVVNTAAEDEAVALLSYHAGVAVEMDYSPSGSGAYSNSYVSNGPMVNIFGYDKRISYVSRNSKFAGKDDDWEAMLYNELVNRRPIYYTGHSADEGHAFVCDGYQKQVGSDGNIRNYFHINWGWTGISDGYYLVTAFYSNDGTPLYPLSQSIGGSGEHYSNSQAVIVGIRPNNTKYLYSEVAPAIYDGTDVVTEVTESKELTFKVNMYNGCMNAATYYYGVEFYNIDTQESTYLKLTESNDLATGTLYSDFTFTWPADLAPATYKVYPCYRTTAEGDLTRVELPYNAEVPTIERIGGEFVLVDGNPYTQASDATYQSVTYKRKFVPGVWNSWYLPFDINTDELAENHLSAACMNGVHQYDDDNDGVFERLDFEILKIKNGILNAATPYFIKPATEYHDYNQVVLGQKTILKSSTMHSVHAETAYAEYDFYGTYTKIENGHELECYIMVADGGLRKTTSYVPAVDWYMNITPKAPMYGDYTPASSHNLITLTVVGEKDETTGIKTIYDTQSPKRTTQVMYNIRGEQVGMDYKGIVILNGKKIFKNNN